MADSGDNLPPAGWLAGILPARRLLAFTLVLVGVRFQLVPCPADTYYLWDGWGGTWYDAEKTPSNTEDDYMCWAAACANVLQWTGWGDVPGQNFSTEDDLFAYYQDHWTDAGGMMEFGWQWWFDGTNPSQGWDGWSQVDVPGGGFWDPPYDFANCYHRTWQDDLALAAIDSYLHAGYGTALAVYNGSGGHAVTVWGYEYRQTGYQGIYITDSDNSKSTDNPPDTLNYYAVSYNATDEKWYLQDFYGSNAWYIGEVQGLDQYTPTPEPPCLLLVAVGLLCLFIIRRHEWAAGRRFGSRLRNKLRGSDPSAGGQPERGVAARPRDPACPPTRAAAGSHLPVPPGFARSPQ